jgi:ABC-type sugar transport system ATPase subunit
MSSPSPPATDTGPLLELRGIAKHFGGVAALRGVDFGLRRGEIHALLGENGAGKSTLIKVLGGLHVPDAGEIHIDGRPARIRSVADADRCGIRLIHQELALAPNLSIAENIFLGREPGRGWFLDRRGMRDAAENLLAAHGLTGMPPVDTPVAALTIAQRQMVEIARALSCRARILVLDEPTSALSAHEVEALLATLDRLRRQGVGLIYISHRIEEILRLADRITVLRDGCAIGTAARDRVDLRMLVEWMAGRALTEHAGRPPHRPGAVVLRAAGLRNEAVHDVGFELREGEILGLAGLVGSGRSELARALFGIDRLDAGEVVVGGVRLRARGPQEALAAGLVLVPEDRTRQGLVMTQSVAFNLVLPWLREWLRPGWPDRARRRAIVDRALRDFAIRVADPEQGVATLSGGNQQKVLVSRWMERRPKALILDEPTRGVDVAARAEMFGLLSDLVADGLAVLLISSDLAEVLALSHRIGLYKDGRILRTMDAAAASLVEVLAILTGASADDVADVRP